MENFLSCFRLAQCYVTINSVKQQWQHFIRSLDSERRKRQHLKKQVQWYVRRESKHLSVPTTYEAECSSQCSVSVIMPYSYSASLRKDDSVERQPTILAHSTAKEKPRRYLRGNALGIFSPLGLRPEAQRLRRQSPTAVPERQLLKKVNHYLR